MAVAVGDYRWVRYGERERRIAYIAAVRGGRCDLFTWRHRIRTPRWSNMGRDWPVDLIGEVVSAGDLDRLIPPMRRFGDIQDYIWQEGDE